LGMTGFNRNQECICKKLENSGKSWIRFWDGWVGMYRGVRLHLVVA